MVHRLGLLPLSAISTMSDTNSPPPIALVQSISQSLVFAGRARSIVIPPRMFRQAPGRGSHQGDTVSNLPCRVGWWARQELNYCRFTRVACHADELRQF